MPSFRIGRLFGIPIEVNASWLFIFLLVAASLSFSYYPSVFHWPAGLSLAAGIVTTVLFFASVVMHEMSHSLVARSGGLRINKVTLFLFGGVAEMAEEPTSPGREFLMAVAGPGMSLLLGAIFFLSYAGFRIIGITDVVWGPLQYLAIINVALGAFNLLPGFPLDGGRVLRALLWAVTGDLLRATLWASRAGQFIGYSMVVVAVFGVLRGQLGLIWFGLVGWFVTVLSDAAYRQQLVRSRLSSVRVSEIMTPNPVMVSGDLSIERLAHDHFLGGRHSRYPVVVDGEVVGLVSLAGVKGVPREDWGALRVADIADRDLASLVVNANDSAEMLVSRLGPERPGALLVVDGGKVVGIVTKTDILARLRVADLV